MVVAVGTWFQFILLHSLLTQTFETALACFTGNLTAYLFKNSGTRYMTIESICSHDETLWVTRSQLTRDFYETLSPLLWVGVYGALLVLIMPTRNKHQKSSTRNVSTQEQWLCRRYTFLLAWISVGRALTLMSGRCCHALLGSLPACCLRVAGQGNIDVA